MNEIEEEFEQLKSKIQHCSTLTRHEYLANSPECPCPYCSLDRAEEQIRLDLEALDRFQNTISGLELSLEKADRVMQKIDDAVKAGWLDSRSGIADARLIYGEPYKYQYLIGGGGQMKEIEKGKVY